MEPTFSPVSRPDLSAAMTQANNIEFTFTTQNYLLNRKPDFTVYLYNVSEQSFEISRPPLIRKLSIPAKKAGERFAFVTSLPSPILMPKPSVDSGEIGIDAMDGRRLAMDIVNPDNTGIDQEAALDPRQIVSTGVNLGLRGVFWSLNSPDKVTEEEVNRAVKRMEKRYLQALEEARAVEVSNPAALSTFLTPEHHAAADYWGEEHSWHGKRSRPVDCELCGTRLKGDVAFHRLEDGTMCVRNWDKAVKAGARTKAQAYEATEDLKYAPAAVPEPVVTTPSV